MDCPTIRIPLRLRLDWGRTAYNQQKVCISPTEGWYPDTGWQGVLSFKVFVEALPEFRLCGKCLEDENAHPDNPRLRRIKSVFQGIVDYQNNEVMDSVGINDEAPESLKLCQIKTWVMYGWLRTPCCTVKSPKIALASREPIE